MRIRFGAIESLLAVVGTWPIVRVGGRQSAAVATGVPAMVSGSR